MKRQFFSEKILEQLLQKLLLPEYICWPSHSYMCATVPLKNDGLEIYKHQLINKSTNRNGQLTTATVSVSLKKKKQ